MNARIIQDEVFLHEVDMVGSDRKAIMFLLVHADKISNILDWLHSVLLEVEVLS